MFHTSPNLFQFDPKLIPSLSAISSNTYKPTVNYKSIALLFQPFKNSPYHSSSFYFFFYFWNSTRFLFISLFSSYSIRCHAWLFYLLQNNNNFIFLFYFILFYFIFFQYVCKILEFFIFLFFIFYFFHILFFFILSSFSFFFSSRLVLFSLFQLDLFILRSNRLVLS